jgi:dTDP-4-dehydrorhamnose reductase
MVADEVGSPTYTADVAQALARLVQTEHFGTYHIVNEGACSRYDLAAEVLRLAGKSMTLTPMALADYKRDTVVPPYTPLRNIAAADLGITLRSWQDAVAAYLQTIAL